MGRWNNYRQRLEGGCVKGIIGIAALMITIQGCNTLSEKPYTIVIDGSLLTDKLSWLEQVSLRKDIAHSIDTISTRLQIEYRDTLYVWIFDSDLGNEAYRNRIFLTEEDFRDYDIILHEVTHAIVGLKSSGFMMEGVAMMMNLVEMPVVQRKGYFKSRGAGDRSQVIPLKFLMENYSLFAKQNSLEIGKAYAEAGMFFSYLVDQYGWSKMRELIAGSENDLERIYSKTLDELEKDWLETLYPTSAEDTLLISLTN